MTPSTLLHPLMLDVVGFQEEEHDYHFRSRTARAEGIPRPWNRRANRLRRSDFNRDAVAGRRRAVARNQPGIPNTR